MDSATAEKHGGVRGSPFRVERKRPEAAAAARLAASEAFWFASKENIQTHGGMGFTWEVDCHLFYRRAKLLAVQAGAPKVWKEKLVRALEMKNAA